MLPVLSPVLSLARDRQQQQHNEPVPWQMRLRMASSSNILRRTPPTPHRVSNGELGLLAAHLGENLLARQIGHELARQAQEVQHELEVDICPHFLQNEKGRGGQQRDNENHGFGFVCLWVIVRRWGAATRIALRGAGTVQYNTILYCCTLERSDACVRGSWLTRHKQHTTDFEVHWQRPKQRKHERINA